jgi:hypothetical protein
MLPQKRRLLALAAFGLLSIAACGETADQGEVRARIAEGCKLNSDCSSPLICAFQTCHVECETTRDCVTHGGGLCVQGEKPNHVCQNPDEQKCAHNSECPGKQVCGQDAHCRDACAADRDCLTGQKCAAGTCAEPEELSAGALPIVNPVDQGSSCVRPSDCPGDLICLAGRCAIECITDKDCAFGDSCVGIRCIPGNSGGAGAGAGGRGDAGGGGTSAAGSAGATAGAAGSVGGDGGSSGAAGAGVAGDGGSSGAAGSGAAGGGGSSSSGAGAGGGGSSGAGAGGQGGAAGSSGGAGSATGGPCQCLVEGDVCTAQGECVQPGVSCDATNKCAKGYACSASGECRCASDAACGRTCTDSGVCPSDLECQPSTGRCIFPREPLRCLGAISCDAGEICRSSCVPAGPKKVGEACTAQAECATGLCRDTCLSPCLRGSDCQAGESCVGLFAPSQSPNAVDSPAIGALGCAVVPTCAPCTAAQSCLFETNPKGPDPKTYCADFPCATTADCPATMSCASNLSPGRPGFCQESYNGAARCAPQEISLNLAGTFSCTLPKTCFIDDPSTCPGSYQCVTTTFSIGGTPTPAFQGLCRR